MPVEPERLERGTALQELPHRRAERGVSLGPAPAGRDVEVEMLEPLEATASRGLGEEKLGALAAELNVQAFQLREVDTLGPVIRDGTAVKVDPTQLELFHPLADWSLFLEPFPLLLRFLQAVPFPPDRAQTTASGPGTPLPPGIWLTTHPRHHDDAQGRLEPDASQVGGDADHAAKCGFDEAVRRSVVDRQGDRVETWRPRQLQLGRVLVQGPRVRAAPADDFELRRGMVLVDGPEQWQRQLLAGLEAQVRETREAGHELDDGSPFPGDGLRRRRLRRLLPRAGDRDRADRADHEGLGRIIQPGSDASVWIALRRCCAQIVGQDLGNAERHASVEKW